MLGFGLPSATVMFVLPSYGAYGVYALTFPVTIILATISSPIALAPSWYLPKSLRVFIIAEYINLFFLRMLGIRE